MIILTDSVYMTDPTCTIRSIGDRIMSTVATDLAAPPTPQRSGWSELWLKEDWWAIWLGLGIVLAALVLFTQGASIGWLAVTPPKWSSFDQLARISRGISGATPHSSPSGW